jgi:hypothetical protein
MPNDAADPAAEAVTRYVERRPLAVRDRVRLRQLVRDIDAAVLALLDRGVFSWTLVRTAGLRNVAVVGGQVVADADSLPEGLKRYGPAARDVPVIDGRRRLVLGVSRADGQPHGWYDLSVAVGRTRRARGRQLLGEDVTLWAAT